MTSFGLTKILNQKIIISQRFQVLAEIRIKNKVITKTTLFHINGLDDSAKVFRCLTYKNNMLDIYIYV